MNFREHSIEWDDVKISRLWDHYARTTSPEIYFSKAYGPQILRHSGLPLSSELEVLDFGCGPGFIWEHLRRLGANWNYTGIDFSPDSVAKVEQKARGERRFRGTEHVRGLPCSIAAERFDVILLFEVVEHLSDAHLHDTLAEAARLLKRGGVLVVTTPNEEDLSRSTKFCPECGALFHEWQHVRNWSVRSLQARLEPHGFRLRHSRALDFARQGLLHRCAGLARRFVGGRLPAPHLIAVFQKT